MPETTIDPVQLARDVAIEAAEGEAALVGPFVASSDLGDHVTDFRFACLLKGYEGWQWTVTLFHDEETERWTVNESTLVPTEDALRPPAWVPWKDRLEPTDLSVTDSIGTDPDDPRIEEGFRRTEPVAAAASQDAPADDAAPAGGSDAADAAASDDGPAAADVPVAAAPQTTEERAADAAATSDGADDAKAADDAVDDAVANAAESVAAGDAATHDASAVAPEDAGEPSVTSEQDVDDAVREFNLSRRHVLTPLGRAQAAKRWYEGQHGPKSLSTKTADGNVCANCGFFIQLKGELNMLFGVCANKWSPDDGRVVSIDHGCGEHSEIDPPEPTHLWVQSKPAYDDFHIDVVAQAPREERGQIELIERLADAGIEVGKGVIVLRSQL
ncbi:DUF3027 domain-containing protein [Bifidobacterium sp. 82T10]|uniref:DUF3027 domain-containing protein n=1 Tax=Bifidobacterium miconis TaxID=2834435 RepID=A0ABS6WE17_9BIFI|nr:DUF3027 domain-containing protein [Bifidobacterium miconis]MBW3091552.1 DUF3027 domain-containing protein [Bifidobacterium miconis]